jgi:hypothetical protein
VTDTTYIPGGIDRNVNLPSSSVVNVREKLVAVFLASTEAPGTAAPCSSTIVPWIVPDVESCAETPRVNTQIKSERNPIARHDRARHVRGLHDMVFLLKGIQ